MKRIFLLISFLSIGLSIFAGKYTIKSMNVKSIKIGNNVCYEGSVFYSNEVIHWTSANEEIIVLDHDANKKRCFSKSLFESKRIKTAGDFYKKINTPATLSASASVSYSTVQPKTNMGEKRYALVIGNSNYIKENMLRAPISDAKRISDVLSNLGFTVYLMMDAQKYEMEKVIDDFEKASTSCDVSLFYYEGHGQQIDGDLYLLPIEATIKSPHDKYNCVYGPKIVRAMKETNAKSKLIFIDACRSEGDGQMGANSQYKMEAPKDGIVMFSTLSGDYAYDGYDVASTHFATAFINNIGIPNKTITEILCNITEYVAEKTKQYTQQQIPTYNSSLTHKLVLVNKSESKSESIRKITFNVSPSNAKLYFGDQMYSIGEPLSFKEGYSYTCRIVADGYLEKSVTFNVNNSSSSSYNISLQPIIESIGKMYFDHKNQKGEYLSDVVSSCKLGEISYLYCNLKVKPNKAIKDTIWSKIIQPDGTVWSCSRCDYVKPNFTYGTVVDWAANKETLFSIGFGCDNSNCWQVGRYTWQLWYKGQNIAEQTFDVLPIYHNEIKSVEFAAKTSGKTYNHYGQPLYLSDIRTGYLYTKITWKESMLSEQYYRCSFYSNGKLLTKYDGKIGKGSSISELNCGDFVWKSPGNYTCEVGDTLGNVWKTYSFTINKGQKICADVSSLTFTNSARPQKIKVSSSGDWKYEEGLYFNVSRKGNTLIVRPALFDAYQSNRGTIKLIDKSNNSTFSIDLENRLSGWWRLLDDLYDGYGRMSLSWGQAKMFAGQGFGAELSTMSLRIGLFEFSPLNFGIRSTYSLDYDVYFAPSVGVVLPIASGYSLHSLYCSAAPTIELYKSLNSPYKKYWFEAELGYRWMYDYLFYLGFFVRYDGYFSAGISVDFSDDLKWL
ncbi:MAG: caspase family protein [Bacteroidales bacterium]|nr:caspase family protein [Bacteroidales bacterium]